MNSLRNERKKSKIIFAALAFSLFAAFVYYSGGPLSKWSSGKAVSASAGIFAAKFDFLERLGELKSNFASKRELYLENEKLRKTLNELSVKLSDYDAIVKENSRLGEILGRNQDRAIILSMVLSKPNRSLYDTLIIDTGLSSEAKEGSLVFAGETLIGKVARVSGNSSKVKLYSSWGEKTEVNIGEKNIPATAAGLGMGNFEIKLPRDAEVKEGDAVMFSEEYGLLGTVGAIEKKESDPFQTILAKSPVNISELGWVQVVR